MTPEEERIALRLAELAVTHSGLEDCMPPKEGKNYKKTIFASKVLLISLIFDIRVQKNLTFRIRRDLQKGEFFLLPFVPIILGSRNKLFWVLRLPFVPIENQIAVENSSSDWTKFSKI